MSKQSYIRKKTGLTDRISRIFLLIALVVIALIFQIVQPRFLMMNNVMNLLATSSIIGVLTLGNMMLMAAGEMSFSIGAQCTVIGAVFGKFLASETSNNIFSWIYYCDYCICGDWIVPGILYSKAGSSDVCVYIGVCYDRRWMYTAAE